MRNKLSVLIGASFVFFMNGTGVVFSSTIITNNQELVQNPTKYFATMVSFKDDFLSIEATPLILSGNKHLYLVHGKEVLFYAPESMRPAFAAMKMGDPLSVDASIENDESKLIIVASAVQAPGVTVKSAKPTARKTGKISLRPYAHVEQFVWKEDIEGLSIKESGPVWGLGVDGQLQATPELWLQGKCEFFWGDVDYDGYVQTLATGETTPHQTTTKYAGINLEGALAGNYRINQSWTGKPLIGLGLRTWNRDIEGYAGYEEDWQTINLLFGLETVYTFKGKNEAFAKVNIRQPILNEETIDQFGAKVEPGKELSFYTEAGLVIKSFRISAFYETYRFGKSNTDIVPVYYSNGEPAGSWLIYQPESQNDIVGIKIGASF